MQDIGFEKANRLSGNAGRAKPDMTIKTDLPGFPVAPLGRGPFDSATTLASGRATVYQRSIASAPQIAYTPAKGHRPLTSSDYDAVTDRRSYRASQLSSLSGSQYVAYGLAAEPSSRRSSMASFSTASSSGSSKNSQSAMLPDDNSHRNSQSDILSHAFQGERSPGSTATGHSMAEVRTAQVIPARSDSTKSNNTQTTSIVTMDEVRRRIELGDRVARTDTVSVDAARLARRSSSSKGQTVGKAVGEAIQDSSSVDIAEPQAPAATAQLQNPRQKSLYAAIESTPKTPPPPMPLPRTPRPISSAQPSANSEAWWMRLSAIRESKSDVPSRPSRSPESSRASSGGSSVSTRHGLRAGYRDQ